MSDTDLLAALRERVQRFETGRNDESDTFYRAATDRSWLLGRLDDRTAVIAAGVTLVPTPPVPSVRESLERLGLPQTTGRIPPEIVHPAPFEDDAPTPPDALDVERVREALRLTDWISDLDRAAQTFLAAYDALEMKP